MTYIENNNIEALLLNANSKKSKELIKAYIVLYLIDMIDYSTFFKNINLNINRKLTLNEKNNIKAILLSFNNLGYKQYYIFKFLNKQNACLKIKKYYSLSNKNKEIFNLKTVWYKYVLKYNLLKKKEFKEKYKDVKFYSYKTAYNIYTKIHKRLLKITNSSIRKLNFVFYYNNAIDKEDLVNEIMFKNSNIIIKSLPLMYQKQGIDNVIKYCNTSIQNTIINMQYYYSAEKRNISKIDKENKQSTAKVYNIEDIYEEKTKYNKGNMSGREYIETLQITNNDIQQLEIDNIISTMYKHIKLYNKDYKKVIKIYNAILYRKMTKKLINRFTYLGIDIEMASVDTIKRVVFDYYDISISYQKKLMSNLYNWYINGKSKLIA